MHWQLFLLCEDLICMGGGSHQNVGVHSSSKWSHFPDAGCWIPAHDNYHGGCTKNMASQLVLLIHFRPNSGVKEAFNSLPTGRAMNGRTDRQWQMNCLSLRMITGWSPRVREITDRFREIHGIGLKLLKRIRNMITTCKLNQKDLDFDRLCPNNSPNTEGEVDVLFGPIYLFLTISMYMFRL